MSRAVLFALLFSAAAGAQDLQERTFRFSHIRAANEVQEFATAVRATSDIRYLTTNIEQPSMTVRGTPPQLALAEWLVNEMDSAPAKPPVTREYRMPGDDDIVRVFYLSDSSTVQELQEAATLIRALTETRRLFTYNAPRAIVTRGTAEQMKTAEWVLPEVLRSGADSVDREHRMAGEREGVVRVFHLNPALSVQNLQEVATLVRSISDIRRLFTYNGTRAISVRGTEEQIKLAQWLISEVEKTTPATNSGDYQLVDGEIVRVFFVPQAQSSQDLQKIATEVRQTTAVKRLFTYSRPKAMAVRGSTTQIAAAERILKEKP